MRSLLVVIACFLIAACQPEAASLPLSMPTSQVVSEVTEGSISFAAGDYRLSLNKPSEWESFPTEFGIVIGERFGSVATAGVLEGLMTYVFVSPLDDFTIDTRSRVNLAQIALNQILDDPTYTSTIAHTEARGFRWDDYDAAYYLISGGDGNATLVIGVAFPGDGALLSCSISAPYPQRARIRSALPDLLDGLQMNDRVLSGDALRALPDPLDFPVYSQ
jgi:hypothetical protein